MSQLHGSPLRTAAAFGLEAVWIGLVAWAFITSTLLGIAAMVVWLFVIGWSFMIFGVPDPSSPAAFRSRVKQDAPAELIGREGITVTDCRPEGRVRVGGEQYEGRSDLGIVVAKTPVRVVAVHGSRIIVQPTPSTSSAG